MAKQCKLVAALTQEPIDFSKKSVRHKKDENGNKVPMTDKAGNVKEVTVKVGVIGYHIKDVEGKDMVGTKEEIYKYVYGVASDGKLSNAELSTKGAYLQGLKGNNFEKQGLYKCIWKLDKDGKVTKELADPLYAKVKNVKLPKSAKTPVDKDKKFSEIVAKIK